MEEKGSNCLEVVWERLPNSCELVYGVSAIAQNPHIRYDQNRAVRQYISRYNTPNQERVKQIAFQIELICKYWSKLKKISTIDKDNQVVIQGFKNLLLLLEKISATDLILGFRNGLIVQKGGERILRNSELCTKKQDIDSWLKKVNCDDLGLDWSELEQTNRYILSLLSIFALKGGDTTLEELNRMKDLQNIQYALARRLSIIEVNYGKIIFTGDNHFFLSNLVNFKKFEEEMMQELNLSMMKVVQGTRKHIYIPIQITEPNRGVARRISDLLGINPNLDLLNIKQESRKNILSNIVIQLGGLDNAVTSIMKLATNEFCDDMTVLTRKWNRDLQVGDLVIGHSCILGVPYRMESICQQINPVVIKPLKMERLSFNVTKSPKMFWQREPNDIPLETEITNAHEKFIFEKRRKCIRIEQKIKREGIDPKNLSQEDQKSIEDIARMYFQRLWCYNISSSANGHQIPITQLNLVYNASYDVSDEKMINNSPHAVSGVQVGFRAPFGNKGNIRYWYESRRTEVLVQPEHSAFFSAFTLILDEIYQAESFYER